VLIVFAIIFYFLAQKKVGFLWLVLPLSIFLDLWRMDRLGVSGLKILLVIGVFWLVFRIRVKENSGGGGLKIR